MNTPVTRSGRGRVLVGAAAVLLALTLWIVVPAPYLALLPLGVVTPEASPALLGMSTLLLALALTAPARVTHRIAASLAVVAAILSALPLTQVPAAIRQFDGAFVAARLSSARLAGPMRPKPFVLLDLVRGVDPGRSRVARGIEFAKPDGHSLTLDVYRPDVAGRFPVVVQIYGGAWQRGAPGDNDTFARYFASRGLVVFAVDYRHAPDTKWPAQLEDVRAALSWIRANGTRHAGDPSRMALVGRSAGAQLALMAAYRDAPPNVLAVVNFYGPTDLEDGWRVPPRPDPLDVRPVLEAYLGGTPDQIADRYREASPVTHASAKAPPTLHLYGTRDHIVEPRFGRLLHERLRAAGATSVLLELPWAEHAFDALPGGLGGQISLYYIERFLAWALYTGA